MLLLSSHLFLGSYRFPLFLILHSVISMLLQLWMFILNMGKVSNNEANVCTSSPYRILHTPDANSSDLACL